MPQHQSAKGSGFEWGQPDLCKFWAPPGSVRENLHHPPGSGLRWMWDHGFPVHCYPACLEPLLPAHNLQLLWESHLHGCVREPPAPHRWAEQAKPCNVSCPTGELWRCWRYPPPGETCLPACQAEANATWFGAARDGLVQCQSLSSLWWQDLLWPRTHSVSLLHACLDECIYPQLYFGRMDTLKLRK